MKKHTIRNIIIIGFVLASFIGYSQQLQRTRYVAYARNYVSKQHEQEVSQVQNAMDEITEQKRSEQEKYLRAKTYIDGKDIELLAKLIYGECNHANSDAEKEAICWCAINRVEGKFGDTLKEVITAAGAFDGYDENNPITSDYCKIAQSVLLRHNLETMYGMEVSRSLPKGYYFFYGDGLHNYFTQGYHNGSLEYAVNNAYKFE